MTHSRTRRLSALTVAVAITALCVAACGSSSSTGSSSAAASASSSSSASKSGGGSFNRSKFEACLKSHGVTLPARPAGAGGGEGGGAAGGAPGSGSGTHRRGGGFFGGGGGAGGGFANNPKLRAALQACGGGRGAGVRRFTLSHAAVTKFVACVKAHGFNLPAPNFSGKGGIFPQSIESSKKFQTAAKSCASDLRPAGAPGPGGAGAPPPGGGGSSTSTT
jgi:hypothetical protein